MKKISAFIFLCAVAFSCHDVPDWNNDTKGNFEALWQILDEHYCFFNEKGIDWDEVGRKYRSQVSTSMTQEELFMVCSQMLSTLQDGHVNLISSFNTSYYRKWWSDYPQNFNERLIEDNYLNFNYRSSGGLVYDILPQNVGYLRVASFSAGIGEGNLDNALSYMLACKGLIIDVRDNGGGDVTTMETLCRRFIFEKRLVGYISHKTGAAHDAFSKPREIYYYPAQQGRVMWGKPVVVLTNRSSFSATNSFVAVMKKLPNVKVVGDKTGGGSGMPFSYELPNGWGVRFSAVPMLDADGLLTEMGIDPTDGYKIDMSTTDLENGRDTILDKAIEVLSTDS